MEPYDDRDIFFTFKLSEAFRRSFEVFFAELRVLLSISLVCYAPLVLIALVGGAWMLLSRGEQWVDFFTLAQTDPEAAGAAMEEMLPALVGVYCGFCLLYAVLIAVAQVVTGASVHAVFRRLRGQEAGVADSLRLAGSRLLPLVGLAILVTLAVTAGALLCFVPGIILTCCLYVAVPALMVERVGPIDAWNRSFSLTEGHRWEIFGIVVLLFLANFTVGTLINQVTARITTDPMLGMAIGQPLSIGFNLLSGAFAAVVVAVVYHDLRRAREGLGADDLVSVFE